MNYEKNHTESSYYHCYNSKLPYLCYCLKNYVPHQGIQYSPALTKLANARSWCHLNLEIGLNIQEKIQLLSYYPKI